MNKNHSIAYSRRSDSGKGANNKQKKLSRREPGRERATGHLCYLTRARSGIPVSGIPSDWLILTVGVNTQTSFTI